MYSWIIAWFRALVIYCSTGVRHDNYYDCDVRQFITESSSHPDVLVCQTLPEWKFPYCLPVPALFHLAVVSGDWISLAYVGISKLHSKNNTRS